MTTTLSNTYNANVPQGTQQINNTQSPIEGNFQDISQFIDVNHIGFNTADTFGKHNFVTYTNQSTAPGASTNQMVMFNQTDSNGNQQLCYQYPNSSTVYSLGTTSTTTSTSGNGAGTVIKINNLATSPAAFGYQYLAGSTLMVFGEITFSTNTTSSYTGTQEFVYQQYAGQPLFSQGAFYIELIPWFPIATGGSGYTEVYTSTGLVTATPISATTFSVSVTDLTVNGAAIFRYMAIGV
jgi:hypothetical protein